MLTDAGLVRLSAIKELSGKPAFLQMRLWQLQHLETTQRRYYAVRSAPQSNYK